MHKLIAVLSLTSALVISPARIVMHSFQAMM